MIYGYCGDQTIRRGPYGDPSPPALPTDVHGGHEQRKGDRIAEDWNREGMSFEKRRFVDQVSVLEAPLAQPDRRLRSEEDPPRG